VVPVPTKRPEPLERLRTSRNIPSPAEEAVEHQPYDHNQREAAPLPLFTQLSTRLGFSEIQKDQTVLHTPCVQNLNFERDAIATSVRGSEPARL
jgi:hypothetical protein